MRILFLTIGQLKSISEPGIYTDLLREFRDNNHEVYVVCARQRRHGLYTECSVEEGMNVLRVRTGNITNTNILEKGLSTLILEKQYLSAIDRYYSNVRFDLIIYTTPPITFDKVIKHVKARDGAISYLLLKDIFPQNAVDVNLMSKKSILYSYFRNKEKSLYLNADYIGCMSEANVKYLLKHNSYINPDTVEVCPNTIEPMKIHVSEIDKVRIRKKHSIPINKLVYVYGGNLGKPQGIDFLINCIRANEANEESFFLVVGSGTEFRKLEDYFRNKKPKNAQLLNYLPKDDYEALANSCDVGLIFLDKRFTIPNFPSRLLSYMQASMPVLAATDVNTDIGEVIMNGEFGYWCESGDLKGFNQLVNKLYDEGLRSNLGNNARNYLENNYTSKHSYKIIMKHFDDNERT